MSNMKSGQNGYKAAGIPYTLYLGIDLPVSPNNLKQACRDYEQDAHFVVINLFHQGNFRDENTIQSRQIAQTRSDTCVSSGYWQSFVYGKTSTDTVNVDSCHDHIRQRSEAIITQEIDFAIHLGIEKIVVELPDLAESQAVDNLARILNKYLDEITIMQRFLIRIRIPGDDVEAERMFSRWLELKTLCNHSTRLNVILELECDLPSNEDIILRFWSEPVCAIQFSTAIFVRNPKNFPVLSKRHQQIVKHFMKAQVSIILQPRHQQSKIEDHLQYITDHLFKNHDVLDREEQVEVAFRNYLQSPLQPLADNLESSTYETFENDSIKYELYEESLVKAFLDKKNTGQFSQTQGCLGPQYEKYQQEKPESVNGKAQMQIDSNSNSDKPEDIVVLYFGAGRGPLIRRALAAAKRAQVSDRVKVIALDKNPNAIITLRNMIIDENLQDRVTLISGDMRKVDVKNLQGDILMSELLGSFGDNELSPECLIPTEKFLKPGGIYLPWSYTNQVIPISSQTLWNEVMLYAQQGISGRVPVSQQQNPFELPYVVKIYNAVFPCGPETKEVFTFRHLPYPDDKRLSKLQHNESSSLKCHATLDFTVTQEQSEFHGFAGYFTAELYQSIFYSINPATHTPGMHSWFPLYFPIKHPFIGYKGQTVSISIWRNNSPSAVWYEWSMRLKDGEKIIHQTFIHNSKGKGYSIGL